MDRPLTLSSFPTGGKVAVFGASGAIGAAVAARVRECGVFAQVIEFARTGAHTFDLTDENSIAASARLLDADGVPLRLVFDATGFLHDDAQGPEKSLRQIDPENLARAFALNAIGPALLLKHLSPLLPRSGKAVFATLSAKTGSIGDNRLGGWYGYRASKAALNQILRTAAIELARQRPEVVCVALHPGTVSSRLSAPFSQNNPDVRPAEESARDLLQTIDALGAADSGGFFDYAGKALPW
jgi:NAD(P)-dependent dehydrogenase (short-subunit alcohol dehydrogenase family)